MASGWLICKCCFFTLVLMGAASYRFVFLAQKWGWMQVAENCTFRNLQAVSTADVFRFLKTECDAEARRQDVITNSLAAGAVDLLFVAGHRDAS
jgi:hypothetical protein